VSSDDVPGPPRESEPMGNQAGPGADHIQCGSGISPARQGHAAGLRCAPCPRSPSASLDVPGWRIPCHAHATNLTYTGESRRIGMPLDQGKRIGGHWHERALSSCKAPHVVAAPRLRTPAQLCVEEKAWGLQAGPTSVIVKAGSARLVKATPPLQLSFVPLSFVPRSPMVSRSDALGRSLSEFKSRARSVRERSANWGRQRSSAGSL
jgi:hypothetical protein